MSVGPVTPNFGASDPNERGAQRREVEKRSIQSMARSVVVADDRRTRVDVSDERSERG
jgi:hypothetical protein